METLYNKWLNTLKNLIEIKSYDEAVSHLTNGINIAFSSPQLYGVYKLVIQIPDDFYRDVTSKLTYGWISFVNGDNVRLDLVLSTTNELQLKSAEDRSSYYGLKAMTTFIKSNEEGLKYGKLAIDVLPKNTESMIMGNAYMTYARQLTSLKKYREGAEYFEKAFKVFKKNQCSFLAITCFVNESLNLYALGEYDNVIKKSHAALMLGASLEYKISGYMDLIKLPMGMCYYEMNKIAIAEKALNEAKKAIESLKLPYLHGLPEIYLFKIYKLNNSNDKMIELINYLDDIFKNMNYIGIKYLILSFKIRQSLSIGEEPKKEWIEELELAYELKKEELYFFILETLMELKIKKRSDLITRDFLKKQLERLRFEGHIPELKSLLLYVAELYYIDNNDDESKYYLNEALSLYKEYDMKVMFLERELKCFSLFKDIDSSFKNFYRCQNNVSPKSKMSDELIENLTSRELEILEIIAKGKSNKEIAEKLFISVGTTKWHINNIYGKLSVKKRFEALEKAKNLNLI